MVKAVEVEETFQGQTAWHGIVHIFEIEVCPGLRSFTVGHPWRFLKGIGGIGKEALTKARDMRKTCFNAFRRTQYACTISKRWCKLDRGEKICTSGYCSNAVRGRFVRG